MPTVFAWIRITLGLRLTQASCVEIGSRVIMLHVLELSNEVALLLARLLALLDLQLLEPS